MARSGLAAVAVALTVAACAGAPLSLVDGNPLGRATVNRYPLRIVSVDGQLYFHQPVNLTPGPHTIVAEAARGSGPVVPLQKTFVLDVAPCTHYHLAADRESPLLAEWSLVIESTERVSGCDPERELQRAKAPG